ncbi:CDP-glycerol glycerophosphotransferase [Staphylococcus simulans]|uniref:CDP-glycerol glycerophosphotransferase family protein n=1 Tax=Staphylococcus simulans TaxID=1286 RepID=UPI000D1F1427|nr:CDP-glycerol glycerophosphotransferase family protein [Staphylococcus simulans]PTJ05753.1 CDP-glycerol glycerophosphotransferase [Staphylococcus simulans]
MLEKIRYKLTRQFMIRDIIKELGTIIFKCSHENFIYFNTRNFSITLDEQEITFDILSHQKNELIVAIKSDFITHAEPAQTIKFYYGQKALWLTRAPELRRTYYMDHGIFELIVNQSITIKPVKTGFKFVNEALSIALTSAGPDTIEVSSSTPIDSVFLINDQNMKVLDLRDNKINYTYIQDRLKKENYKVHVIQGTTMYPAKIESPEVVHHYFMEYDWTDEQLSIDRMYYAVDQVYMTQLMNTEDINLSFFIKGSFDEMDKIRVGLIDVDYENAVYLPTQVMMGNKVTVKLALDHLETTIKKKLFIEINGHCYLLQGKTRPFDALHQIDHEIYQLQIRNRYGLTITHRKPKFKLGINQVAEESLNMYFQPHPLYQHCRYYLTFEERISGNQYHLPIARGVYDISIDYDQLNTLLTENKSIIDVFITIYDEDTLIRKEKIKYRQGVYKKDGIHTLKTVEENGLTTFFMLTLTPFKNIKFETFTMTERQLQILNDHNHKDPNIWMVGERRDTAQESGIQLFEWLYEHAEADVYYVIDGESKDYEKIKDMENVLVFGSDEHLRIAPQAKVVMSTHDIENIMPYKAAPQFFGYDETIKIFLQHGVLGRKNVEYHKKFYDDPFDLFNVSSHHEKYDIVVDEMGYEPEEIAVTGLARYDRLPLEPKPQMKKVLIMPTWRDWLNSNEVFEKSEYLRRYISFLNNPELKALSEQYGVEINFYPHYRAQQFFQDYLSEHELKHVNFIELGTKTVQDLLIEHDLLITDFSTVSTDFNYMDKPVIFYHFDVNKFFRKGILRPINETFIGDITYSENELISKITDKVKHNEPQHYDRSLIFDHIDHQNCARIYDSICEELKKQDAQNASHIKS